MADSLILNWSRNGIVAVTATVTGQQVRVNKTAGMTWPENATPRQNAAAAGNALKTFLQEAGISANEALVCLSRDAAVTRMLDVPKVSEDELTEIVRLQAATRSSQPAEQLLIDYLPQPDQPGRELGSVLAATLNRSTADAIHKTLSAAGLEATGIGMSSVGLAAMATTVGAVNSGETIVAAALIESRLEVSLVRNGNIPFLQSAVLTEISDDTVSAEMRRILFSAEQKLGELNVARMVLFVESARQTVFPQLQQEYGPQLTVLTLADTPQIQLSGTVPETVCHTAVVCAVGLLLNRTLHTLPGIDFLHPREKKAKRDDRVRKMALYAAGVLVLLILGLYWHYSYRWKLDAQISLLESRESSLNQELKDGAPVLNADGDLQEWLARDVHTLLELEKMEDTLPGTAIAVLKEYNFDVASGKSLAKVNGKGMAVDRDDVEQIRSDFDAAGFNVYPDQIDITRRDPDYPWEFTLTLERPVTDLNAPPTMPTGR